MRRTFAMLLAVLLLSMCACAPDAAQQSAQDAAAPAMEEKEPASEAGDALVTILTDISENYHPGTAGSSLTSARMAGQILDWYAAFRPAAEDVVSTVKDFVGSLDGIAAATMVAEQLPGIYSSVSEVLGETGRDLLDSAGYTPVSFPWSKEDAEAVFSGLFGGFGLQLPKL